MAVKNIMLQAFNKVIKGTFKPGVKLMDIKSGRSIIKIFAENGGSFRKEVTRHNGTIRTDYFKPGLEHWAYEIQNAEGALREWTHPHGGKAYKIDSKELGRTFRAHIVDDPLKSFVYDEHTGMKYGFEEAKKLISYMFGGKNAPQLEQLKNIFTA